MMSSPKMARICSKRSATSRPRFSPPSVITLKFLDLISTQFWAVKEAVASNKTADNLRSGLGIGRISRCYHQTGRLCRGLAFGGPLLFHIQIFTHSLQRSHIFRAEFVPRVVVFFHLFHGYVALTCSAPAFDPCIQTSPQSRVHTDLLTHLWKLHGN